MLTTSNFVPVLEIVVKYFRVALCCFLQHLSMTRFDQDGVAWDKK
jgi:hypothetical protein